MNRHRPPWLIRAMARHYTKGHFPVPMSNTELCQASGLNAKTIRKISYAAKWDGLERHIDRFFAACGVDFWHFNRDFLHFVKQYGKRRYAGFQTCQRRKFEKLEREHGQ